MTRKCQWYSTGDCLPAIPRVPVFTSSPAASCRVYEKLMAEIDAIDNGFAAYDAGVDVCVALRAILGFGFKTVR